MLQPTQWRTSPMQLRATLVRDVLRNVIRRVFSIPPQTADPRLEDALTRVDVEAARLRSAVQVAQQQGVFEHLRDMLNKAADEDASRIRGHRR